ncbi:hypothetical protein CEXT_372111 [Caerostris extrusa]|uniref:Uncharacterized protein n=1 Tax=Caerostris extrusa TaxID=172846 RepID=A0AAV4R021_CAEEX|nr:hypothetical protein CEXT_372111 [Caerostris extrusa]
MPQKDRNALSHSLGFEANLKLEEQLTFGKGTGIRNQKKDSNLWRNRLLLSFKFGFQAERKRRGFVFGVLFRKVSPPHPSFGRALELSA